MAQRNQKAAARSRTRFSGTAPERIHRAGQRRETSLWNERWPRGLAFFLQPDRQSESPRTRGRALPQTGRTCRGKNRRRVTLSATNRRSVATVRRISAVYFAAPVRTGKRQIINQ